MSIPFTLNRTRVRRVTTPSRTVTSNRQIVTSGDLRLDSQLPEGGWPLASLTTLTCDRPGEQDMRLIQPTIDRLLRYSHRRVALINPPRFALPEDNDKLTGTDAPRYRVVHGRDNRDAVYHAIEAMQSGDFGVVMLWLDECSPALLQRLDRAADRGHCLGFFNLPALPAREDWDGLSLSIRDNASQALSIEARTTNSTLFPATRRAMAA